MWLPDWLKLLWVKGRLRQYPKEWQDITIARRDGPYRGPLPPYPEKSREAGSTGKADRSR